MHPTGLILIATLVGAACFTGFVAFWAVLAWTGFRLVSILLKAPTLPEGLKVRFRIRLHPRDHLGI